MADKYVKAEVVITALEKEVRELRAYKKAVKKRAKEISGLDSPIRRPYLARAFIRDLASDEFGEVKKQWKLKSI